MNYKLSNAARDKQQLETKQENTTKLFRDTDNSLKKNCSFTNSNFNGRWK